MPAALRPPPPADDANIFIVSHRGPHDFVWEGGRWIARAVRGGLASMLEPLARQPNVAWFCTVSEPPGSEAGRDALFTTAKDQTDPGLNVIPVPLPADVYQGYYGEISNEVLWMLQHRLVGQFGFGALDEARHRAWENGYLEASRRMADAIAATEIPARAFLIQDYHLYPLAALLRARFPKVPSLHFIHIPFPDPMTLRLIPRAWREAILRGLLGADVVGLQTPADVRAFLACCEEELGATVDRERDMVIQAGHNVRARAFPMSIDPAEVSLMQASEAMNTAREALAERAEALRIVRVDRLDPTKNQALGFTAFGRMLEANPALRGRVEFLALLLPSRTDLTIYHEYRDAVMREVSVVNARWREACGGEPVRVLYTNDRAQAFAALESCDVLLVNSREDGMNLAVKEWAILSRKPGALVVSETTGVAAELAGSALLISPLDVEGTARALAAALAMPVAERTARLERLRAAIAGWTARDWLAAQLKELNLALPEAAPPVKTAGARPGGCEGGGCVDFAHYLLGPLRELTVRNHHGLHARPAAAWVRCARGFDSEIEILKEGQSFAAQSIFGVLTANLGQGATFTLRATGDDAAAAVQALGELLEEFERQGL